MQNRPYVAFAEVKDKVPLPDVLKVFGIEDRFTRKHDMLTGVCPFPSHAHGPSPNAEQFKIQRKEGVWLYMCFGDCHRGGDVVEFVKTMTGFDDAHVRFWFAEHFGDRLNLRKPPNGKEVKGEVEKDTAREELGSAVAPQAASVTPSNLPKQASAIKPLRFHLNLDPNVPYLVERGVAPETIQRYRLGLCARGLLKGYVCIPIFRPGRGDGENPVAYLGRWPGDDHDETGGRPRYKFPEGFPKSRVVYGLDEALEATDGRPLIVVEGAFKVYHLVQAGFPNTVAVLGSWLADEQAEILIGAQRPIVLFFDGDEAGQKGMRTAAAKLIRRAFVRVVTLDEGQEPDTIDANELRERLGFVSC